MSRAKIVPTEDLQSLVFEKLPTVSHRAAIDRVMFALSFKAGLRACEIAGLRWVDVLDVAGDIVPPGGEWHLPDNISKKGSGRKLLMHHQLYDALVALKAAQTVVPLRAKTPVIPDENGLPMSPNYLQKYMARRYAKLNLVGCSSHSGRRTFITTASRRAGTYNCSLRDVQLLAGHKNISTTERYIDLSDGVKDLIAAL